MIKHAEQLCLCAGISDGNLGEGEHRKFASKKQTRVEVDVGVRMASTRVLLS